MFHIGLSKPLINCITFATSLFHLLSLALCSIFLPNLSLSLSCSLALSLSLYSLTFFCQRTFPLLPLPTSFLSLLSLSFCPSLHSRLFYVVCWCIFTFISVLTMKLWRGVSIESSKFHSTRGFLSAIFSKILPRSRGLSCHSCP